MDEPFGAVDPITRQRLQDELLSIQRELRKTIVCVTHDIDEAIKLGDRIVILRERQFDHAQTDFPLAGKHKLKQCASCHRPGVRHRQAPGECVGCHRKDDKHKGTLGNDCARCHTGGRVGVLTNTVANLDNYHPVAETSVKFGFNKDHLTKQAQEALERATVVIDCTPAGNENKKVYETLSGPRGFLAQGSEFGFGAEIGISTQKLHARGPMALPELTTTKWVVEGDGQIRV